MRFGYLALSALIGLAGIVLGDFPRAIAPAVATPAPAPRQDRVQIEHEIVRIPVMPDPRPEAPRLRKAGTARSLTGASRATTRVARADKPEKRDPLSRAVQRIVGDGRYTPQPFPRPAR
jgi:hypothetical protein